MTWIVLWLYVVALAVWLGETVFFSFAVAPRLFGNLPVEEAGRAIGLIFPAYYMVGCACGAVAAGAAMVLRRWSANAGQWSIAALVSLVALAASLYAGIAIQPRASALRGELHGAAATPAARQEFDELHTRAVQLNAAVLICTLALSGLLAAQLAESVRGQRRLSRYGSGVQL
ncbi:MAG: DUF4149 domain-containing protein [Candidatus Binatia bacterium]